MKAIPRVKTEDRAVDQLQSNIVPPLNALLTMPLLQGNLITTNPSPAVLPGVGTGLSMTGIALTTAAAGNRINHGLGRNYVGWLITRKRGLGDVYEDVNVANGVPQYNFSILLRTSVNVIIDLYIF